MTLTKIKPLDTIKYKVFRGHLEPVIEQRKCEVNFYTTYLEVIQDYTFQGKEDIGSEEVDRREAIIIRRNAITVWLHEAYHDDDPEKNLTPKVSLYSDGEFIVNIHLKTMDEAYNIYNKIKNWLTQ